MVSWKQLPAHWHTIACNRPNSVLLQTARFDAANNKSLLFLDPIRILTISRLDEVLELFSHIEEALLDGLHVAGYLSYECGYHFDHLADLDAGPQSPPLAWFGIYRNPIVFHHETGTTEQNSLSLPASSIISSAPNPLAEDVELNIAKQLYSDRIYRIQQYIETGDTYQVNFTDSVSLPIAVSPDAAFAALLKQQPVPYSALLNAAGQHTLSLSPELFFKREQANITTRPMKGTMPRGLDLAEDAAAALLLQEDGKNRAEHLMIVDLLRNDLGRICAMGSVHVDDIFSVERYATLLQMTSSVSGKLNAGLSYYDIFKALFPSGSITGAPKIRTMQIIRELEQSPRGIYTGAIGFISPGGIAAFNVAIRTLILKDGKAHMGVGGGIVADSTAAEEYRECKLKAAFLVRPRHEFQLIETMLCDREFFLLPLHLDRLQSSAAYFDFPFDREAVQFKLAKTAGQFGANERHRVRLLLDEAGQATITSTALCHEEFTGRVRLSAERTASCDVFLRHKTTHRSLYDAEFAQARAEGFDDILFMNEKDEVAEGAISNLFIQKGDRLLTPPLASGVLPGVFRRHLLETNPAAEQRVLFLPDIVAADGLFLCSAVRGLRRVTLY